MTTNQIAYAKLKEDQRHNQATEVEMNRSNIAKEVETNRSNQAKEAETNRSNLAQEIETNRANKAKERLNTAQFATNTLSNLRSQQQNEGKLLFDGLKSVSGLAKLIL